jgi:hypothetical protein
MSKLALIGSGFVLAGDTPCCDDGHGDGDDDDKVKVSAVYSSRRRMVHDSDSNRTEGKKEGG